MNLATLAARINLETYKAEQAAAWPEEIVDWLCKEPAQTLLWATDDQPDLALLAEGWLKWARAEDRLKHDDLGLCLCVLSAVGLGLDTAEIDFLTLPF